ncbi:hypothetical protein EJ05DRAFT_472713 [Pseudovirgaria hyperparasitica]|uniref:N-acetyltransferase domain-containing protein n=1 Tax=Pseudovirgaria hyperparasitica TaxID=470096 RepID=A0A6A6WG51_9PEZI|nr:uncharacterized protein EJ05DRAFT_472713 [Pseudovirgaria hyperparasitica]KAF2761743.1 hypothetical protein EJ05DRAFT_472713 [Pseudovirgaria hyperparasitica]
MHSSEEIWKGLVLRQKEYRLGALQASPQCFASSYDREVAFEHDVWDTRLRNPLAETLVAVRPGDKSGRLADQAEVILYQPWLGTIVLTGPMEGHNSVDPLVKGNSVVASAVDSPNETMQDATAKGEDSVPHYQLNAIYVSPSDRGLGIGKLLIDAAIERVVSKEQDAQIARITLIVDYYNHAARRLYERCGFQVIRRYFFDDPRLTKHDEDPPEQTEAAVMERIMELQAAIDKVY